MSANFKKIVLFVLVVVLAFSMIGCGDGDKKNGAPAGVVEAADTILAPQDAETVKDAAGNANEASCAIAQIPGSNFVCQP